VGKKAIDANNKTVVWATVAFVAVLFFIVLTLLFSSKKNPAPSTANPTPNPVTTALQNSLPYPKIKVTSWITQNSPLKTAPSAQIYEFKRSSPEEDANKLAKRMVGASLENEGNGIYATSVTNNKTKDSSFFVYNANKGEVSYASTRGIVIKNAETFLKDVFFDPTLRITSTYKKKSKPGITYYEAHRDWDRVGLPILNPFGLLNVPESEPLSNLSFVKPAKPAPDADIVQASDSPDGIARQADFNTVTIGVQDKTNTVATFKSNIRPLQTNNLKIQSIIPYSQAVEKLKKNEYSLMYTAPVGTGIPQFNKVYPGNQGIMQKALVSESVLAYLEEPPQATQRVMEPHYIFRGTGQLDTGYRVQFIAAVPAKGSLTDVKGASTLAQNFTPQQGTFFITGSPNAGSCGTALTCPPTPTPTPHCGNGGPSCAPTPHCGTSVTCPPSPTPHCGNGGPSCPPEQPSPQPTEAPPFATLEVPTPTDVPPPTAVPPRDCHETGTCPPTAVPPTDVPPPPQVPDNCPVPVSDLENIREVDGFTVGQRKSSSDEYLAGEWYVIPKPGQSIDAEQLLDLSRKREFGNDTRMTKTLARELSEAPGCPVRFTGPSPTLFIYTNDGHPIQVTPDFKITYTDTVLQNGSWNDALQKEYIYYEYELVNFIRPQKGWNVKKSDIALFAQRLSNKLSLTQVETTRLKFELGQAASSIDTQTLFIGIIPQKEIDAKIPLTVSGTTDVKRIHFFISVANQSVTSPVLTPVQRSQSMIVELGAVAQ